MLSNHLEVEYATRLLEDGTPGRGYGLKDSVSDLDPPSSDAHSSRVPLPK